MDKSLRLFLFQLWILFILLIKVESFAIRTPNDCGKSETFEIRYFGDLTSDVERFTTAYQGTLWNIYYVRDDRYRLKVNFIFPNKPADNVNITTPVRTSTDKSNCDTGKEDFGIIRFKCGPKPTSQHLKGVELQLINLKPFTKEHSGFTMEFQAHDFWNEATIHDECSVKNVPVEEVTCDPPRTAPTDGQITCTNTNKYASVCSYTCNEGYGLSSTNLATTTCNGVGVSAAGSWSSVAPQCEAITCDPPRTAPTNGKITCTNTNKYASVCTYTCDDGYGLSNTNLATTTCNGAGVSAAGNWNSVPPQCEAITCDPPRTAATNGKITCTNTNKYASVCSYACNEGYGLSNTSLATTTCNGVGVSAAGVWSSVPPQCEAITCDPPRTAPTDGQITCTNTNKYASVCTYTCNEGYGLSNTSLSTTTCNGVGVSAAGNWNSVPPQCEEVVQRKIDLNNSASNGLNGGGIAAIVICVLIIVIAGGVLIYRLHNRSWY